MSFYAAVESIEAMFCEVKPLIQGRMGEITTVAHCRNHKERNATLRHCYNDLFLTYTTLYGQNRIAKYRCYVPVPNNGQNAELLLRDIENKCNKLIKGALCIPDHPLNGANSAAASMPHLPVPQ
jgi:hypothetical protein